MWRSILNGADAALAARTIDAIADRLRDAEPLGADLATGSAGLALFFAYLYEHTGRVVDFEASDRHLEHAVAHTGDVDSLRLLDGLVGVAWVIEHIAGDLQDETDPIAAVDAALIQALESWQGPFDLSMGLAGFGLYALERWPRATARTIADAVGAQLLDRLDEGRWATAPEHTHSDNLALAPSGYVDFGVAHGAFGPIGLLSALAARTGDGRLSSAASGATAWIADHLLGPDQVSRLPFWLPLGAGPIAPARLAWCYGDAGPAATLLAAAEVAGEPSWRQLALDLADAGARRSIENSGCSGVGLCHGAAGIAHIYNRLGQRTGERRFLDVARRWFEHLIDLDFNGDDFMNGAAGAGLALLAAISDVEPEWDRVLLMSIEPTPE